MYIVLYVPFSVFYEIILDFPSMECVTYGNLLSTFSAWTTKVKDFVVTVPYL